ncbi:MAG: iron-sulfur cluster assembly scaffold protein [Acidobacteria bacterium]|nr:iron-sulfur cluster assembly scaffold protein [Acidobacteriota bacterium]
MYTEAVLDHFKNPRNAGDLIDATAGVEVTNPVCGDILRLAVRVEDGRIAEVKFKAQGCVTAVACASVLTEMLQGMPVVSLAAVSAEKIAQSLGGLPPTTEHGSVLAADAVAALLKEMKAKEKR